MKKLLLYLALAVGLFGADAANDLLLSQRKADNSGNIQRNVAPTTNGFLTFNASKVPTSPADLTYATPTFGVPDAFNINSAGSISLTGGGSNKDISAIPSGTGSFIVAYNGAPTATFSGKGALITGTDSLPAYYNIQTWGASSSGFESFVSGGTKSLPTAVADGTKMFSLRTGGYDGTSYVGARGYIEVNAVNNWSTTNRGTTLIIGTTPPNQTTATQLATFGGNMVFRIGGTNMSVPAWGTSGVISTMAGATFTDTTSSGTVASAVGHSLGRPTIAANSATTYTDASTLYIGNPPAASTNVTITNPWAIWVDNGNVRFDSNTWTAGEVQTGSTAALAARINYNLAAYGTGTVYTLTNSAAAVDFGTTDPSITLDKAGTYLIQGRIQLAYAGATVVAETATVKLRRTNNTATDLTSGSTVIDLPVSTTLTYTYGTVQIPPVIYTTSATTDTITIFANVSATLGAGTITAEVGGTNITAIRLY